MVEKTNRLLVALGGNAIKKSNEEGSADDQFRNVEITCKQIIEILNRSSNNQSVIITHGNGPQAGNLAIQQEEGKDLIPSQPLDIIGAMTQGQIGYMIQQTMQNFLKKEGLETPVITVATQVLVDKNDSEFVGENASKPIGPFYTEGESQYLKKEKGYVIKKVKPTGEKTWRRVVASPDPLMTVEGKVIKQLSDLGVIVIASGGGGIPVINEEGRLKGIEAVIDKDLAGERLAEATGANIFLILTDVEKVKLNYGKPDEKDIDYLNLAEAKKYHEEGHFLPGSMGPKIGACIRFIEWGGKEAIITSLDKALDAIEGKTGTHIVSNCPL
jgi:carbamate kinase